MSILNEHWTDSQVARFAQACIDEGMEILGIINNIPVKASTFFLNPAKLGCCKDPASMRDGIRQKLKEVLPKEVFARLPKEAVEIFKGLGDYVYSFNGKLNFVLSRPDDSQNLFQRIAERTNIAANDLTVDASLTSCGYDNLELLQRLYLMFQNILNGGDVKVKKAGIYHILEYQSMLGARRKFLLRGGDVRMVALHQAVGFVAAFTKPKIAYEYTGFMDDFGFEDGATEHVYKNIYDRLVDWGYTSKTDGGYRSLPVDSLLNGLSEIFDGYVNRTGDSDGKTLAAFHKKFVLGKTDKQVERICNNLSRKDFVQEVELLVVLKSLRGLKEIMGDNTRKYAPERSMESFDRMNNLLKLQY